MTILTGQMREAYDYILEMENRRIPVNPYIEADILDTIYRANGHNKKMNRDQEPQQQYGSQDHEEEEDVVDEEIEEVIRR